MQPTANFALPLRIAHAANLFALSLAFFAVGFATTGCGLRGKCEPDNVNEYAEATRVPPTGPVKDAINEQCDRVDWKYVSHHTDSQAKLTVRVGDPFEGHDLSGTLSLYDQDAQLLQQADIRTGETRYDFVFPVTARAQYYLKVEATKGGAPYSAEVIFERLDPCANCPAGTECRDNKCMPIPCMGACPIDRCDLATNQCRPEDPCGGPCPSGQMCDEQARRCVPEGNCRTNRDCPDGQVCNRKTGRCFARRQGPATVSTPVASETAECQSDTDCKDGRVCAGGKCVEKAEPVDLGPGKQRGKITASLDSPEGVVLRIAVSPGHGIKGGDSGIIHDPASTRFTVTKVGGERVEALVKGKKKSELPSQKATAVTITLSSKKQ